jgi:hypothetical protein
MENKRYIDKVLEHIVNRTKIDYDKGEIIFPFFSNSPRLSIFFSLLSFDSLPFSLPFVKYCNNQFGLTEEEVEYVYHRYVKIIKEKITNE